MNSPDLYAVFGQPINHSKSPQIHRLFAEQTAQNLNYHTKEVGKDFFESAANNFFTKGGEGLNCTVPLKECAYQFATKLTQRATFAKAVNTLSLQQDGSILGDNTDGCGLVMDLINHQISLTGKRILILGAGGASRGIIAPIIKHKPKQLVIVNRSIEKALKLATEFQSLGMSIHGCGYDDLAPQQFDLILNATSASLSNQLPPLPKNLLAKNGCCYDLAYGNQPTIFVNWGIENKAIKSLDGLGMLIEQAAESFYIWRGIRPNTQRVMAIFNR